MARRNRAAVLAFCTKRGHGDIFDRIDRVGGAIAKIHEVAVYYQTHEEYPTGTHPLALFLKRMRYTKAGKRDRYWRDEYDAEAAKEGLPEMFSLPDSLKKDLEMTRQVASWYHTKGFYPPGNKNGGKLGKWRTHRIDAKQKKGDIQWHEECEELAIELECPGMFWTQGEKDHDNIKQLAKLNPYPTERESYLGRWRAKAIRAKAGRPGNGKWDQEWENLANELGRTDMFPDLGESLKEKPFTIMKEIAQHKTDYGHYPTAKENVNL